MIRVCAKGVTVCHDDLVLKRYDPLVNFMEELRVYHVTDRSSNPRIVALRGDCSWGQFLNREIAYAGKSASKFYTIRDCAPEIFEREYDDASGLQPLRRCSHSRVNSLDTNNRAFRYLSNQFRLLDCSSRAYSADLGCFRRSTP